MVDHPVARAWEVDCADFGLATLVNSHQRIQRRGFSVMPPMGSWCVGGTETAVIFTMYRFGDYSEGRSPSAEEIASRFFAMAYLVEGKQPLPTDSATLRTFVEKWLRNGGMRQPPPLGEQGNAATHFAVMRSKIVDDNSLGATCVRSSSVLEELDKHSLFEQGSYVCLHPNSAGDLVIIGFSERLTGEHPLLHSPSIGELLMRFLRGIRFDTRDDKVSLSSFGCGDALCSKSA
jgi:hypothetical protein